MALNVIHNNKRRRLTSNKNLTRWQLCAVNTQAITQCTKQVAAKSQRTNGVYWTHSHYTVTQHW